MPTGLCASNIQTEKAVANGWLFDMDNPVPLALSTAFKKLGNKLILVATGFLLVALLATGLTLLVSWNLEGGAAAVNQTGRERMRAYRIAMLLSQVEIHDADRARIYADIDSETHAFEQAMRDLESGDPSRPMFLPGTREIQRQFARLRQNWSADMKPAIAELIYMGDTAIRAARLIEFRRATENYVDSVDALVYAIERDISKKTSLLRSLQMGLIGLSVAGTVALIYLMFLLVIRPVNGMAQGMRRMEDGDFDARLPIETRDEFGSLAAGFNRMAARLQDLYRNLADKVAQKTRSLERQNRELSTISEVAALLNHPGKLEDMCRDFLRKLMLTFDADGGAVRLIEERTGKIHLYVHEKLAPDFVRDEACMDIGECHCGEAALHCTSAVRQLCTNGPPEIDLHCRRVGYDTLSVFTIQFKNKVLGIFNMYFKQAREFDASERLMLESLGKHLGAAIENQRLVAREKEMAVSEERNLLAQELHDSIAQSLAFLNLQAQMLDDSLNSSDLAEAREGLGRMRDGIQESYDDVRELLVHFRTKFGESDVGTAVRSLLDRFEADTGIASEMKLTGNGVPLSPETQIQALHIVQECLSNARKHSGASQVIVELERGPVYRIGVSDDGCGFEPGTHKEGHVGLAIMRERAQRIGGNIAVHSRPGAGTRVTLTLPIVQEAAAA
jgi:two-component system nitrate/nitrite sensor histidine kinase NarX